MTSATDMATLSRHQIVERVDELYRFRDLYIEEHSVTKARQKPADVHKKMTEVLEVVEQHQAALKNKAEYLMLKGKCLNVKSQFDEVAQEVLSKAVKLDPKHVEAWNILGEIYWKKGDIDSAKNCFVGALQHSTNKISLRNLSMVLRQFGNSREEKLQNINESVLKAKEAINLDISDGTSWFVLGNAYLAQFFGGTQKEETIQSCLKAYSQAEKDLVAKSNPDLHFNRSMCYLYQSDFYAALASFSTAADLDPTWEMPLAKLEMIQGYLNSVSSMIATKCGMLGKNKLQKIVASISTDDLGPYGGGSYTSPLGKSVALDLRYLDKLHDGANQSVVISGKVIGSLSTDPAIPYTFVITDAKHNCIAVCLYNVSSSYGVKTGDSVAIPEPYLMSVHVQTNVMTSGHDVKDIKYNFIRVATPMVLVVNGKKLGIDKQAPTVLNVTAQSD